MEIVVERLKKGPVSVVPHSTVVTTHCGGSVSITGTLTLRPWPQPPNLAQTELEL